MMIQNKLIRAKNGNQNTSNFKTELNPPITLSASSSIALQSFNMELTPNIIDITSETNKYSYATLQKSANAYNTLIQEHTFTIPINSYSPENLAYNLTLEANKQLFYESTNEHTREQGAEIKYYYNEDSQKISFIFAGRLKEDFCGTPIAKMSQNNLTGTTYNYSLSSATIPDGIIKRLTPTTTEFDFYEYSTVPFCKGSGEIAINVTQSLNNYVIGLINPLHLLSNPSSNTILEKMRYGIMLLDNTSTYNVNNFPQNKILIKDGEGAQWLPKNDTTTNSINIILGKRSVSLNQGYKLFFKRDSLVGAFEYEYGDYVLICATYTQNNIISYKICESKIGATTTNTSDKGYYSQINPEYINMSNNNFINLENIQYDNNNIGFVPNQPGSYVTLNLFNRETAQLFGYEETETQSTDIYSALKNVVNVSPRDKINARYQFPDSLKLVVDLPLDCYDDGKNQNILCFISNNILGQYITYQPSPPLFITLKNNKPLYLDHITFKLYDNNDVLLPNQTSASAVVIIQSIK